MSSNYQPGAIEGLPEEILNCIPTSGPIHRYMAWAIKTTDAEPLFHLGSILPCWSHAVCTRGFTVDEDHRMVPKLWTFLVGVPASSKSTAMKRALSLYRRHYPTRDPFVLAEGSVPGIFEALCDQFDHELDASVGILYRDEAARLLDTTDSIADMLCNIIDGETVKRHLRGARAANAQAAGSVRDTLLRPQFSGILTTTFSRLREVTKASYLEGGLYSRFLWFVGQPRLVGQSLTWNPHRAEEDAVLAAWNEWSAWANGLEALGHNRVIRVPPLCVELLRSTLFANLQAHGSTDNRLNAARKRGINQAILIAGLYAASQQRDVVDEDDMDRAINLVEFCLAGMERLDPSLAVDEFMQAVDFAFHAIAGAGDLGIATSKLFSILRKPKTVVDAIVDTLVAEGSIRRFERRTGQRGRPAQVFIANGPARFAGEPQEPENKPKVTYPASNGS